MIILGPKPSLIPRTYYLLIRFIIQLPNELYSMEIFTLLTPNRDDKVHSYMPKPIPLKLLRIVRQSDEVNAWKFTQFSLWWVVSFSLWSDVDVHWMYSSHKQRISCQLPIFVTWNGIPLSAHFVTMHSLICLGFNQAVITRKMALKFLLLSKQKQAWQLTSTINYFLYNRACTLTFTDCTSS